MAEDERLGRERRGRHLLEVLFGLLDGALLVLLLIHQVDQPVAVDALGLVQPELHEPERVLDLLRLGHEHPLEDARHVTNVELVVEVEGGLAERARDLLVVHQGRLHHLLALLLHVGVEVLEVAREERVVDGVERLGRGEANGEGGEEALQARVDDKGARGRVHRREVLRVHQHLLGQLVQVVDMAVPHVLAHERDVGRRVVLVEGGHVEVVDKVDELLVAGRAVVLARLLLERPFELLHEREEVGEVVDVDRAEHVLLAERAQLAHDDRGLADAGRAEEHRAVLAHHQVVHPVVDRGGLARGHGDHRHGRGRVVRDRRDGLGPRHELELLLVDVVVPHLAARREAHPLPRVLPPLGELFPDIHP